MGHSSVVRKNSIDINDFSMSTAGGGGKTNGLMKFIQDMLDLLNWYNDVPSKDKKPKANESTMETRNKELVPPPEPEEYYTKTHETWKDTGEPAGSQWDDKNSRTLKQVKIDSAALMKKTLKNTLRSRDSVTIHKKSK